MIEMLNAAKVEQDLGIEVFATTSKGIGGVIRQKYEDFTVKEIPAPVNRSQGLQTTGRTGNYSVFWLQKQGLDTILAIKKIAKALRVSQKRFSFAGMKDKKALTFQRVSAWNVSPQKLAEINLNGICIEAVSQSDSRISIGSNLGNQFAIVVRKIPFTPDETEHRAKRISDEISSIGGTPNFFGHQRFGLMRPITHIVGLKILKGDFKGAAMVFLSRTSGHERDDVTAARTELGATEDFKLAVTRFPTRLTYELALLNRLSSNPNNFANALRALPRRLLQMFVSAAQGWLFNRFLSRRLVNNIPLNQCLCGDVVALLDADGLPLKETTAVDSSNIDRQNENLRFGRSAVVYPVPGFDMKLPKGEMQETVREVMAREDLVPRSFWISKMPEISSQGVSRPIVVMPKGLKITPFYSNSMNGSNATFEFSLIRGSYATVLLREFMKNDDPLAAGY
jgi:tRNA pseudouridine13 synthase